MAWLTMSRSALDPGATAPSARVIVPARRGRHRSLELVGHSSMGQHLPVVSGMELHRVLRRLGWIEKRKSGHWQMRHPEKPDRRVSIPMHRTALLPATLTSILTQAGITVDELRAHL